MPVDYSEGKIYKLICKDGHYYIGSTACTLGIRFAYHRSSIKNNKCGGKYEYFSKVPIGEISIELIENCPCDNKDQLNEREDELIKASFKDPLCLNTNRAFQASEDKKEYDKKYYENNKEKIQANMKQYYEEHKEDIMNYQQFYGAINKEKVDEYQANYRKENAEKRREYSRQYAEEHQEEVKASKREYYEKNKERLLAENKEYVAKNKDKIKVQKAEWQRKKREEIAEETKEERAKKREARKQKSAARIEHDNTIVKCECGGSYQNYRKKRHDNSKTHLAYAAKLQPAQLTNEVPA